MLKHPGRHISALGLSKSLVVASALGVAAFGAPSASAQSLSGSWAGSGTIVYPSGETERARCKATFRQTGGGVSMHAVCATASARVTQNAELARLSTGTYSGEFTNIEYGISGSIRVKVHGTNKISASLNAAGATAQISLNR